MTSCTATSPYANPGVCMISATGTSTTASVVTYPNCTMSVPPVPVAPPFLPVYVTRCLVPEIILTDVLYTVILGTTGPSDKNFSFTVHPIPFSITIAPTPPKTIQVAAFSNDDGTISVSIVLLTGAPISAAFDNLDGYIINFGGDSPGILTVTASRVPNPTFTGADLNGGLSTIPPAMLCDNVNVPIIFINGVLTPPPNYSDIAYVEFTISDEFTYYKEKPLPHEDKCVVAYIPSNKIKQTILNRCCPFIVSVLKGKGHTAFEKATYIYNRMSSSIGPSFFTFYFNLVLYSMSVYILSRILYGNFDINYVLRKHYDKFIKDLGNSRFCTFLQEFLDCTSVVYGYQRFFKYGHHSKDITE